MAVVFIPTPHRDLTGGLAEIRVDGTTIGELLDALDLEFPGLRSRLCRGEALAPGLQVSIDDVMTGRGLRAVVRPDSEVHFLPAIGGGSSALREATIA
jgi:molybdopterin synthase sulfur carrier subunit